MGGVLSLEGYKYSLIVHKKVSSKDRCPLIGGVVEGRLRNHCL